MQGNFGGQSMIAPLRRVLMRRPDAAFGAADPQRWHYTGRPDLPVAQAEHDALAAIIRDSGAEVVYHDAGLPEHADAIFVFDPTLITNAGAIVLSMGKPLRRGEEPALGARLAALGIPTIATLEGAALAEGGDMFWLDDRTLALGLGYRTNREGARQIAEALRPLGAEVLTFDLPHFTGPEACLHLLSLISLVDERMAVVYPPLMPVPFYQELEQRGFHLIECPEAEFATMATNVLATAPGECVMLEGNPITQARLAAAGCEVRTYRGYELSLKAEGGPTCLTRPLLRG